MAFFLPYLFVLIIAFGSGVYQWRRLSIADKWLCILLAATILQETIAQLSEKFFHQNFSTYHIYTPIELFIIAFYFDHTIKLFKPYRLAIAIGGSGVVLSVLNTIFLEPFNTINTYFLLTEGCVVIVLCLVSFYKLMVREKIRLRVMSQFWITTCFLFYWCLTYMNFGLYGNIIGQSTKFGRIFAILLYSTNLVFYIGISITYLNYKKLVPSGE